MQGEILPCKEETLYKPDPERLPPNLSPILVQIDAGKVENCPVVCYSIKYNTHTRI